MKTELQLNVTLTLSVNARSCYISCYIFLAGVLVMSPVINVLQEEEPPLITLVLGLHLFNHSFIMCVCVGGEITVSDPTMPVIATSFPPAVIYLGH